MTLKKRVAKSQDQMLSPHTWWLLASLAEKQKASNMDSWELGKSSEESGRRMKEPFRRMVFLSVGVMDLGRNGALDEEDPRSTGSMLVVTAMVISNC